MKAQKNTTPNLALQHAIVDTQRTQRVIAKRARIHEVKLCQILKGQKSASPEEQARLAKVLGQPVEALFPSEVLA